jgi:predicted nucleotidyltransferase
MDDTPAGQLIRRIDPEVRDLLDTLQREIRLALGSNFVGLYLYGSLVTGDFDKALSDVDLLAVTSSDIDHTELARLEQMHRDLANLYREWDGRIEVQYLSVDALKTFRWRTSRMAVTSPGEPFHTKDAGKDWLLNWYIVREMGVALFGPPPETVIDQITKEEFVQAVVEYAQYLDDRVENMRTRPGQAYSILSACRALYSWKTGEQISKKQAALWAEKELPEWAPLIENAIRWREAQRSDKEDSPATLQEAATFVHLVVDQITGAADGAH